MIAIEITYGSASVTAEDKDRACAAAEAVLAAAGVTPEAAHAEFRRQWTYLGDENAEDGRVQDYEHLTGDAALWVRAEAAANAALTEGWARPAEGGCCLWA